MSQIINKFIEAATGATVTGVTGDKMRLNNAQPLRGRNAANSADVNIIQINASNVIEMQGAISLASNQIHLVADPTSAQDASTKNYVDTQITANAGANKALSNLAAVAINASLLPGADNTIAAGSATLRYTALHSLSNIVYGSTSGAITLNANATTASYAIAFPAAQGGANTTLQNNGSGSLSWVTASTGTVTSVALTAPAFLTVAGSPVTTSGTLALSLATQTANTVFAGPGTGVAAAPTFRALVAADIPVISLTAGVSGILPIANGGTNSGTTLTNSKVIVSTAGALVESATTTTQLGFLDATSSIQTQLNGKANLALSNLASVAINTSLLPGTDNSINVGSASFRFAASNVLSDILYGSTSGAITLQANATTTSYTIKMPAAQGASSSFLQNDGSGNLSWVAGGASGANQTLSNLTSPTAINQDLLPAADVTQNVGSVSLRFATVFTPNINSGTSALLLKSANSAVNSATTGNVTLISGDATGTTANSGDNTIKTGAATANTGSISIMTGNPGNSGLSSGSIALQTGGNGSSTAQSGDIILNTSLSNASGSGRVIIGTGFMASASGTSGLISLQTGNSSIAGASTGNINIATGTIITSGTRGSVNITSGITAINASQINITVTGSLDMGSKKITSLLDPTSAQDAATKNYVDTHSSSVTPNKETFTLSSTDITNQFVDLAQIAKTSSILFMVKGAGSLLEGASFDYSVNYTGGVGGKTRITFLNQLATAGAAALVATDVVQVNYIF